MAVEPVGIARSARPRTPAAWHPDGARRAVVVAGALALAAVAGVLTARDPLLGLTLVAGLAFVPIAFSHPPIALAAVITTSFLGGVPGIGAAANRTLLLLAIVLVGALLSRRSGASARLARRSREVTVVAVFVLWMALTVLWAPNVDVTGERLVQLAQSAVVYLAVVSLVAKPRDAALLAASFVLGAVLSILWGAADGALDPSGAPLESDTTDDGRLQGGAGDPNYLGAAIVSAVMLAGGLAARRNQPVARLLLLVAVAILGVGLAATASRGGFLALGVVVLGALVVWRGRRRMVLALVLAFALFAGAWFAAAPGAWERVSSFSDGGTGRSDIWQVAWRVIEDHPIVGVGINQFPAVSPLYLDRPGFINRSDLLVERHSVVHNVVLQIWVDGGLVGLLLFATLAGLGLAAAFRAARRFDALGDPVMASLSRAALLALAGMLAASFFLSNYNDRRVWMLLAFGPALLGIASRRPVRATDLEDGVR